MSMAEVKAMNVSHKEQQAEFRRLKAERKSRLETEDAERKSWQSFLQSQRQLFLSHDDLLNLAVIPKLIGKDWFQFQPLSIINIEPCEGGWRINLIERKHVA